jgi:hypothetical protein
LARHAAEGDPGIVAAHGYAAGDGVRHMLRGGVKVRGIYDPASLDRPGALAEAIDSAAAGEMISRRSTRGGRPAGRTTKP